MKLFSFLMLVLTFAPLWAQEAAGAAPAGEQPSAIMSFLPFILLFVVMWLFFIRPKQKEMKKMDDMRKTLKKGDKVLTFAGIMGFVHNIDDNTITIRTGSSTIEFQKAAIQSVVESAPSNDSKTEETK